MPRRHQSGWNHLFDMRLEAFGASSHFLSEVQCTSPAEFGISRPHPVLHTHLSNPESKQHSLNRLVLPPSSVPHFSPILHKFIYLGNQFPRLIHRPSESYLFPLLTLRQTISYLAFTSSQQSKSFDFLKLIISCEPHAANTVIVLIKCA